MKQQTYIYDVETLINFFSAIFENVDNSDDIRTFVLYPEGNINEIPAMLEFITNTPNLTLVGHNSLHFDDLILKAILHKSTVSVEGLHWLAGQIINNLDNFRLTDLYKQLKHFTEQTWKSIDTMAITRINRQRLSLKFAGIILKYKTIKDFPLAHNEPISSKQVPAFLAYNKNDTGTTKKLFRRLGKVLQLRRDIGELFGVDIITANDTEIAKQIYNVLYAEKTNSKYKDFKETRNSKESFSVRDCIGKNIEFHTKSFQDLLKSIQDIKLNQYSNFKYKSHFEHDGTGYELGVGGLHSKDKANVYISNKSIQYRDSDILSFHPINMINNNFLPQKLGLEFKEIFEDIVHERIRCKALGKRGDKLAAVKAQGLKIAINSTFGLMGNQYYWLYDPQAMISVTISSQLYLLDLIEKLSMVGIKTLSANTDGIICGIEPGQEDVYYDTIQKWESRTQFTMEYTDIAKFVQRDVNNYIAILKNGKVKTKGCFSPGIWNGEAYDQPLNKGYKYPIVPLALYNYYVDNIPIVKTIKEHRDIHDFICTKRVDMKKIDFIGFTYVNDNGDKVTKKMQKTNRWIITNTGGGLCKYKGDKVSNLAAGQNVQVLNDVEDKDAHNYDLNYDYYINEAQKIISKVEPPKRFSLFG